MFVTRLFTATILLGSFLLFLVQPMIGRMVLPRLGGSPQVWNSAMLFYQVTLLGGYLYAHHLNRAAPRTQTLVHLALFVVAGLTLPVGIAALDIPATANPALWLLGLLALSIGPLFFVVSAQAPLMQAWFARTGSGDPYPLYAASNVGSLAALLAYPALVEPFLTLRQQSWLWTGGFALLALLVAACARQARVRPVELSVAAPAPWRDRLRWVALAAVPSGLLLSTTTHLTTDVMAMPLLWVIPLALYLVSFIIAFSPGGATFVAHATRAAPALLIILGSYVFLGAGAIALMIAVAGLVLFFVIAIALHGALAAARPAPSQLTDFYLWMSVGGVIGGLFCALVAPIVFDWPYEHPILLIAAAVLLPVDSLSGRIARLWTERPGAFLLRWLLPPLALVASFWIGGRFLDIAAKDNTAVAIFIGMMLLTVLAIGRRYLFAFYASLLMLTLGGWSTIQVSATPDARARSFFGAYEVRKDQARQLSQLMHGTTLHGVQSLDPARATYPMSYYAPSSGIGQVMSGAPATARIGFVGLGAGTLACFAKPGQRWSVYEIDPTVVRIARNPRQFSYISRCKPDLRVVLGDARLTLAKEPAGGLDILAIDAFSSDAIPLHLLTREAFDVYARTLARDGVLLMHVSNRHLDLEPVVAAIAASRGWSALMRDYQPEYAPTGVNFTRSLWIALARDKATLDAALSRDLVVGSNIFAAAPDAGWRPLRSIGGFRPWTDDHASILPILKL